MRQRTVLLAVTVSLVASFVSAQTSSKSSPTVPTGARTDMDGILLEGPIVRVVFSPLSDKVALVNGKGHFGVWDIQKRAPIRLDGTKRLYARHTAITRDGKMLTTLSADPSPWYRARFLGKHTMQRWDLTTGKSIPTSKNRIPGSLFRSAYVSGIDAWVIHYEKKCALYDAKTGEELHRFSSDAGIIWPIGIDVSTNGRLVAVLAGSEVNVYDLSNATTVFTAKGIQQSSYRGRTGLQLGFGSQALLIPYSDHISVWNLPMQREAYQILLPQNGAAKMSISEDGTLMAESDNAGVVTLWDLALNKPIFEFDTDMGALSKLVLSPNGRHLLTGSLYTGEIAMWDLNAKYYGKQRADAEPQTLARAWATLGSSSPMEGYRAQWTFLENGEAAEKWLEKRIESSGTLARSIPRWIKQLGAPQYAKRKQAKEKLAAIGAPAVPALQTLARTSRDPEVIMLARELLKKGMTQASESVSGRRVIRANALIWRLRNEREAREAIAYTFPKAPEIERPKGLPFDRTYDAVRPQAARHLRGRWYSTARRQGSRQGAVDHAAETGNILAIAWKQNPNVESVDYTKARHMSYTYLNAREMMKFAARKDVKNLESLLYGGRSEPHLNYDLYYEFPKLTAIQAYFKVGATPEDHMKPMPNLLALSHTERGKELKSFEFLRKFPNLEELYLGTYGVNWKEPRPLPVGAHPKLRALRINMWQGLTIKDLDAYMAGKPNLTDLEFKQPKIEKPTRRVPYIIDYEPFEPEVEFLSKYPQLKSLRIVNTVGPELDSLGDLTNLEELWLKLDPKTSSLKFLAKMPKLQHLYLCTEWSRKLAKLDDLSVLKDHASLEGLWLHGLSNLKDISVLKTCKKLKYLSIKESQLSLDDLRAFQKAMPNCYIEQLAPKKKQR